jgi:sodium-dependent dicarboxylate transporter 2/3/5
MSALCFVTTFGIVNYKVVAFALGNHVILLLTGAFMLLKAIKKSGIDVR